ncbi:MAG: ATP-binding cassette domain-containing protein [Bacteroidetes bacterium]|nr:ATP-binding cassette domain-containing protein [Bacteroidota bacterium]
MARPNHNSNGSIEAEVPKAKLSKKNLRESLWLFQYIKPYRVKFVLGLIVISLSSASTMAFPYLLKQLLDSITTKSYTNYFTTPSGIAVLMVALLIVQMFISFMRVYLFTQVGENVVADLRKDMYKRMITMPMDFFSQRRVGELSSRLSADVSQIQDTVTTTLSEILRGVLTLLIGMSLIFVLSTKLAILMLSLVPILVVIALVFSKYIRKMSKNTQDQLADSNIIVQESLQGISNVKAFSNEGFEIKRYSKSISDVVKLAIKSGQLRGLFISFMLFSVFGIIVLLVWYATGMMQQGLLTFGKLTAFVVYTVFVSGSMAGFAEFFSQLQKTLGATQRVRELLKETPEPVSINDDPLFDQYKLSGSVTLDHVAFRYPSRPEIPVIKDVSIHAKQGEQIAIVGPSGAGKSTIASILLRFYDPEAGRLLFDNKDARDIPITQLRKQLALVPQDVLLFGGSIYENIIYGKPDATKEEVEAAAVKANAHNFIKGFPEGYDTVVGERGVKLSGGQRQRIAIARAILKDPVILILDEATSSLDSESEALVQDALNNLMKNRTSFVIAHRLSTIRNADKIVVLEHGVVKEAGTHKQLLEIEGGLYKSLSTLQFESSVN